MIISFVQKSSIAGEIPKWKKAFQDNAKTCNYVVLLLMAFWMLLLTAIFFLTSTLLHAPVTSQDVHNSSQQQTLNTLRFVHAIFRHGRRTPLKVLLDDPNNKLWERYGAAQLTKEGMQDGYAFGKWFQQRYHGFISQSSYDREVMIESTDYDRTLQSAQLFAAALYPPIQEEVWNNNVGTVWQPYPVHPLKFNGYLSGELSCPRLEQFQQMLHDTPESQRLLRENQDLFNLVSRHLEKSAVFGNILDIIMIEAANNLKHPDWITTSVMSRLEKLQEHYAQNVIKTREVIKLQCGDFIRKIMYEMMSAAENRLRPLKAHAFSVHDVNLICLMGALDDYNSIWPPFSSALIFELHENERNGHYVKVLYRNESMHEPNMLRNSYCFDNCSLGDFWNFTMPYFVEDMRKECTAMGPIERARKQTELNNLFS